MLLNRRSRKRQRTSSGLASGEGAVISAAGFGDRAARLVAEEDTLQEGMMASFAELVFAAPSSMRVPSWEKV